MKEQNFRNVIFYWDENSYPNLLNESNVIYLLTFPDDTIYVGKCNELGNRLFDHCKLPHKAITIKDNKIRKFRHFNVDILYQDDDVNRLGIMENKIIHNYAKEIYNMLTNRQTNYKSYTKYVGLINNVLLNKNLL